ncbi:MAG: hypothetical protein HKM24_04390 [Gammaproteobacteria bacterium]|nr:hypothetical protein [Gammaproteobacteria bacterium]
MLDDGIVKWVDTNGVWHTTDYWHATDLGWCGVFIELRDRVNQKAYAWIVRENLKLSQQRKLAIYLYWLPRNAPEGRALGTKTKLLKRDFNPVARVEITDPAVRRG